MQLMRGWTIVLGILAFSSQNYGKIIFEKVDYTENHDYLTSFLTIANYSGNSVINMDVTLHKTWDLRLTVRDYFSKL
jgi:hypothetical protein